MAYTRILCAWLMHLAPGPFKSTNENVKDGSNLYLNFDMSDV